MQLMSIEDLAVYLGDSKRTIYKYIASGDCPPYMRISAKNIKFDRADVDAWLESKKATPKSPGQNLPTKALPWTAQARRVLKLAEKEAKQQNLYCMGTEHLLSAIIAVEDCIGAIVLKNTGIDVGRFRELYEQLCNKKGDSGQPQGEQRLINTLQMVIHYGTGEAIRYGHTYIGTEHLLGAIFLVSSGLGCRILHELGVTIEKVRSETAKLLACHTDSTIID